LGEKATPQACRELQAYWLQLETEWLRAERSIAGVLAFCYLTNNYGFTGDWFINDIKDLEISPTLKWFKHCFAPEAVFINLPDERYAKHLPPHSPGTPLVFQLAGVNDGKAASSGKIELKLIDSAGNPVVEKELPISIPPYSKKTLPCFIELPQQKGGYVLTAEYYPEGKSAPTISRRYLKIGDTNTSYSYFEIIP
jgi:hypothetical protein